jgi:aspartate/methionine/tyrosine aminotransferase
MQSAPPDAINLALGELRFELPDLLRRKALEILKTGTPVYTPNAGTIGLREAIAAYQGNCKADDVCVSNGAEEAIFITLLSLLNPGDRVAIPDPDYPAYPAIVNLLEAEVVRLPFNKDFSTIDWDEWDRLLGSGIKAVVLSSPSNPSGFTYSPVQQQRLESLCRKHHATLIVDEIYRNLCFTGEPCSWNVKTDIVFLVGGLSKSHCMSGWRLGWVVAPPYLSASLVKARQYVSTCSNWLSQHLAEFALSSEGMAAAEAVRNELHSRRDLCRDFFSSLKAEVHIPDATPYLLLKVEGDDAEAAYSLARKGVLTVPGSSFGEVTKGWLRMNYAVPELELAKALGIIRDELHLH